MKMDTNYQQGFEVSGDYVSSDQGPSKLFDDDGRPKRTGNCIHINYLHLILIHRRTLVAFARSDFT